MEHYIPRDNIENKIQKLISDRSVSKKLFCLYGVEKIGKTFTLEYVRNEMLKNALVMFLPLNHNNISNPIFLKNSILQLLNDTGIANEKNFNVKDFLLEMFKGLSFNVGCYKVQYHFITPRERSSVIRICPPH